MPTFWEYNPEQAYLLPPSVKDVLGEEHLCFFVHRAVEKLDVQEFAESYREAGHPAYQPALLLKVWLYAYALGVTSSRRLAQRVREDLAFRYLAGGAPPDFWALNEFRKRHGRAVNEAFTQIVERARSLGMGRLGQVAMDSTPLAANASLGRLESVTRLRAERAKIRRSMRSWQRQCDRDDPNEAPGTQLPPAKMKDLEERLAEIPRRLERLRKAGVKRLSKSAADSRVLRNRQGFLVGYRATVAVSEDHRIVAPRGGSGTGRPWMAGAPGRGGGTRMPRAARAGARGCGIFLCGEFGKAGGTRCRPVRAGRALGPRTEPGDTGARTCRRTTVGAASPAAEVAQSCRPSNLSTAQAHRGSGSGSAERTTWHAAVPLSRVGQSGH
jgi:transposase